MNISALDQTTSSNIPTTSSSNTSSTSNSKGTSMDDFFKLMAAQLKYQDPMQPQDNDQFMQETALFSILQQVQDLSKAVTFSEATQALGKTVGYYVTNKDNSHTLTYGKVSALDLSGSTPQCYVNGQWTDISNISGLLDDGSESTMLGDLENISDLTAPNAIGKTVSYTVANSDGSKTDKYGVVQAVKYTSDSEQFEVDNNWIDPAVITGFYNSAPSTTK